MPFSDRLYRPGRNSREFSCRVSHLDQRTIELAAELGHALEGEIAGAVSGDLAGGWAEKAVRQGLPWLARKHAEAWDTLTEDELHQVAIDMARSIGP